MLVVGLAEEIGLAVVVPHEFLAPVGAVHGYGEEGADVVVVAGGVAAGVDDEGLVPAAHGAYDAVGVVLVVAVFDRLEEREGGIPCVFRVTALFDRLRKRIGLGQCQERAECYGCVHLALW